MVKWTKEACFKVASSCSHKKDLDRTNEYVYKKMLKHGWLDEAFPNSYVKPYKWTYEELKQIASQYPSKNSFKWGDWNAYHRARTRPYFEEICSHMKTITKSDADVIYLLKSGNFYKIGITSDRCKKRRLSELKCHSGMKFDIIRWVKLQDAKSLEEQLLKFGETPPMTQFSGYKECRVLTEQELTMIVDLIDQVGGVLSLVT